jgi:hypothetical protein
VSAGTLIEALSTTGSSTVAGLPNVNGIVYFFVPGTTTPTTVYSDAAASVAVVAPVTLDNAGRFPYATYPNGIYATGPIRLLIYDSTGMNIVSDTTYQFVGGSLVLSNADFPSETTIDAAFTAIGRSLGTSSNHGQDAKVLVTSGATGRYIRDKFVEVFVSVKDFGAIGDGITNDTVACQAAMTYMGTLGSGTLKFPAGTYKILSSPLVLPNSLTGISIIGDGPNASIINQTTAVTDSFDATSATGLVMRGIAFTGGQVLLVSPNGPVFENCQFTKGVTLSSAAGTVIPIFINCTITASSDSVILNGALNGAKFIGTAFFPSAGACVHMKGSNGSVFFTACYFSSGTAGVLWDSGATGGAYAVDCPTLSTGPSVPFDATALSSNPGVYHKDCGLESQSLTAVGGSGVTVPVSSYYHSVFVKVTSTGGTNNVLIGPPTPAYPTSSNALFDGQLLYMVLYNSTVSGVNYLFDSVYALDVGGGAAGTAATRQGLIFRYDIDSNKWRQIAKGVAT